jgi:hypothetical protein
MNSTILALVREVMQVICLTMQRCKLVNIAISTKMRVRIREAMSLCTLRELCPISLDLLDLLVINKCRWMTIA